MTNSKNLDFISTCVLISQILLSIICITDISVILTYTLHLELSAYLFPASIISAIILNFLFADQLKIEKRLFTIAIGFSFFLLLISLIIAWIYFDFSWDGQWYQQAAVYNLAEKWNPIFKPLITPDNINNTSILHFPKNSWFFGACIYRLKSVPISS